MNNASIGPLYGNTSLESTKRKKKPQRNRRGRISLRNFECQWTELWGRLLDLIVQIWPTESVPNNWKTREICSIFKKEVSPQCNIY